MLKIVTNHIRREKAQNKGLRKITEDGCYYDKGLTNMELSKTVWPLVTILPFFKLWHRQNLY